MTARRKPGRPSVRSPQLAERICSHIAEGMSLRAVCKLDGMPDKATVMRWLADDEGFRDQYARARDAQADAMAEEILEIADDARNDWMERQRQDGAVELVVDQEHIQRSKLRVDTRKWLMAKLWPKKYGDRLELEHNQIAPLTIVIHDDADEGDPLPIQPRPAKERPVPRVELREIETGVRWPEPPSDRAPTVYPPSGEVAEATASLPDFRIEED